MFKRTFPIVNILLFCLLGPLGALSHATEKDSKWYTSEGFAFSLFERSALVKRQVGPDIAGAGFRRTMDGRVVVSTHLEGRGRLATQGYRFLKNQVLIEMPVPTETLFSFDDRAFGILADRRIVEFTVPRISMEHGHFSGFFKIMAGVATASGAAAAACAHFGGPAELTFLAGAIAAIHAYMAVDTQYGCTLNVEAKELRARNGEPFLARELYTVPGDDSQSRGEEQVNDVLVQAAGEAPRLLSDVLYDLDTCTQLLLQDTLAYD